MILKGLHSLLQLKEFTTTVLLSLEEKKVTLPECGVEFSHDPGDLLTNANPCLKSTRKHWKTSDQILWGPFFHCCNVVQHEQGQEGRGGIPKKSSKALELLISSPAPKTRMILSPLFPSVFKVCSTIIHWTLDLFTAYWPLHANMISAEVIGLPLPPDQMWVHRAVHWLRYQ